MVSVDARTRDAVHVGTSVTNVDVEVAVTNSAAARFGPLDADITSSERSGQIAIGSTVSLIDIDMVAFGTDSDSDTMNGGSVAPGGGFTLADLHGNGAFFEGGVCSQTVVVVVNLLEIFNVRVTRK